MKLSAIRSGGRMRLVILAAGLCLLARTGLAAKPQPANILFILADDLGWSDLGCYGSTFHETPHLDLLAAEGMRFTEGYAASPICSPTRSSILTGKNPARTNNTQYFGGPQPGPRYKRNTRLQPARYKDVMDLEERTLAEALNVPAQGYCAPSTPPPMVALEAPHIAGSLASAPAT